jgi:hypothetical protein
MTEPSNVASFGKGKTPQNLQSFFQNQKNEGNNF